MAVGVIVGHFDKYPKRYAITKIFRFIEMLYSKITHMIGIVYNLKYIILGYLISIYTHLNNIISNYYIIIFF